jgi:hypothetical protein
MVDKDEERTCPACGDIVEDGETVIFFGGEMYHVDCAPGARPWPPPPRAPRF